MITLPTRNKESQLLGLPIHLKGKNRDHPDYTRPIAGQVSAEIPSKYDALATALDKKGHCHGGRACQVKPQLVCHFGSYLQGRSLGLPRRRGWRVRHLMRQRRNRSTSCEGFSRKVAARTPHTAHKSKVICVFFRLNPLECDAKYCFVKGAFRYDTQTSKGRREFSPR